MFTGYCYPTWWQRQELKLHLVKTSQPSKSRPRPYDDHLHTLSPNWLTTFLFCEGRKRHTTYLHPVLKSVSTNYRNSYLVAAGDTLTQRREHSLSICSFVITIDIYNAPCLRI